MNKSNGYIKVPRSVLALPFWIDPWDTTLWFYCALRVTYKQYGSVKPGQFISSQVKMASDLHWSRNSVKKHLDNLHKCGCIDVEVIDYGVRITLKHWHCLADTIENASADNRIVPCDLQWSMDRERAGQYEFVEEHEQSTPAQEECIADQNIGRHANMTPPNSSGVDHIQEIKEGKEENSLSAARKERERDFSIFWAAYPRHENERRAKATFTAMNVPLYRLMAALECAKQSRQWLSGNGRFIPNAEKWLDGTWRDYEPEGSIVTEPIESEISKEKREWTTF